MEGDVCPICKGTNFTNNWQGRIYVKDVERSMIAEKTNTKEKGEYAIKAK